MEWFTDESLNPGAINRFFEQTHRENIEIHTMQIYRGGKQIMRVAQEPYSCTDAREVYSLSKLFASTVVGIAVTKGLVQVTDRLVDIFQRKEASEKFSHMTLRHLLSMNTGHETCVMPQMVRAENAIEAFFDQEPVYEPGTYFAYNTGASCMLCAVVERVSGMKFFDFACRNLFYPMGMTEVSWGHCQDGLCCGGVGLHVSSDSIMKLGLLYRNFGVYDGKRILSEEWVREASSCVSDNSGNGTPDWCSGYGYQIWKNSRDGYRGDGAFGQLCMVLPGRDAVVAVQADVENMQREIDLIFDLLDGVGFQETQAKHFLFEPISSEGLLSAPDGIYQLDENPAGLSTLQVCTTGDTLHLVFADRWTVQKITASIGTWTENRFAGKHMVPTLFGLMTTDETEQIRAAACCAREEKKTVVLLRYQSNPHRERLEITCSQGNVQICYVEANGRILRPRDMILLTGHQIL